MTRTALWAPTWNIEIHQETRTSQLLVRLLLLRTTLSSCTGIQVVRECFLSILSQLCLLTFASYRWRYDKDKVSFNSIIPTVHLATTVWKPTNSIILKAKRKLRLSFGGRSTYGITVTNLFRAFLQFSTQLRYVSLSESVRINLKAHDFLERCEIIIYNGVRKPATLHWKQKRADHTCMHYHICYDQKNSASTWRIPHFVQLLSAGICENAGGVFLECSLNISALQYSMH